MRDRDWQELAEWEPIGRGRKYRMDNAWGYFAWWRENYFE